MRQPRHKLLVEKAIDAAIAAIEVYNKPDFHYREESFAILMLNSWELLLKARILSQNNNKMRSIEVWEAKPRKDGKRGTRLRPKLNRSGNIMTIGVAKAAEIVRQYKDKGIDDACVENINLLIEIRDNAIHLHNITRALGRRVQEVGAAALRNFMHAIGSWFGVDLAEYNFFLLPLAFDSTSGILQTAFSDKSDTPAGKLLEHIIKKANAYPFQESKSFCTAVEIEVRFARKPTDGAIAVQLTRDPNAPKVQLTEEDLRQRYPWDYEMFCGRMKQQFGDFKQNDKFYRLKAKLEKDNRFCLVRHLDPIKPKNNLAKKFYSPNILGEFKAHYTEK